MISACRALAALMLVAGLACPTQAELRDSFESTEPCWRDARGDAGYRIAQRMRVTDAPRSGRVCEFFEIDVTQPGSSIYLSYDVGQAPVIVETGIALWVRGQAPGLQLAARVVFPRSLDSQTGQPLTALLTGGIYSQAGQWEQLTLRDVNEQVEQQARILRAQLRRPVDTAQAYVDRILVNAYVGLGTTRLWLDDLEVSGVVRAAPTTNNGLMPNVSSSTTREATPSIEPPAGPRVELRGQTLLVADKPFYPRMIEYCGEPLKFLQQLGFNTVRFRVLPERAVLDEARSLGLWIVCPPPQPADLTNPYDAATGTSTADFGPWFAPVLAWDLGDRWTEADFAVLKRWSEFVRRGDQPRPRPLVCGATADLRLVSRQVDIVELNRRLLGTTFELARFGEWIRERSRLMRPGTPIWTTIQSEPSAERLQQAQLMAESATGGEPIVESEQIRLMLYEALAAGVRGVHIESRTPLSADDPTTRLRAATLQLLNLELELIDVWTSAGTFVARVPGNDADVSAALLQIDRGHLLLPVWTGEGAQYVPGQSAGVGVSFVVPGVPESVEVLEITPGGLRPLNRKRVAGGLKITLDEFSLTSLVLLTQDPQVVAALAQRLSRVGQAAADQQRALSAEKFRMAELVHGRLLGIAPRVPQADAWLGSARNALLTADARAASGTLREAYFDARRAMRPLALLERAHWKHAVAAAGSPNLSPHVSSFVTLPQFWRMNERLKVTQFRQPILAGGDFENLQSTIAVGWRHYQHEQPGIRSDAELAAVARRDPAAPQYGSIPVGAATTAVPQSRFSLRLAAAPLTPEAGQTVVETPPVWITSPAVQVSAGQLVRVSGWVFIPKPIGGNLDGLVVFDSAGGETMAERFNSTTGWKQFTYYRMAPADGVMTLTAALAGFGEAFVDDLSIDVVR